MRLLMRLIFVLLIASVLVKAEFDLRPGYHFLPKLGSWMNDPNGATIKLSNLIPVLLTNITKGIMVYAGTYHLFFQYDPTSALGTGPKVFVIACVLHAGSPIS